MKEKDFLIVYGLVAILVLSIIWNWMSVGSLTSEVIMGLKNPQIILFMLAYIFGVSWVYDKFRAKKTA